MQGSAHVRSQRGSPMDLVRMKANIITRGFEVLGDLIAARMLHEFVESLKVDKDALQWTVGR